ncbi:MAG: response regulator [Burkholderiaceae bacterium]|nr:response regulator [Burkholderiaceae bacterium]
MRILAVEDNADALHVLCELLVLLGHEASGAPDAARALELLSNSRFDVLLTDVNLAGQSGIQLARQARADAPEMDIVFVSGYDENMARQVGFPASWLTKPYDVQGLIQALNRSGSA